MKWLYKFIKWILGISLPKPDFFAVFVIMEKDMDKLKYRVVLPVVPSGSDVVKQHMKVMSDTEVVLDTDIDLGASSVEFSANQDSLVSMQLTYIDDAGNVSEPRIQTFTAVDIFPPAIPGEFGLVEVIDEIHQPDEPSDPPATE